jgi:hypothetical protein
VDAHVPQRKGGYRMTDSTSHNEQWLSNLLKNHPALIASGLYVFASIIGMYYAWSFLWHFQINVFNYAQIGDFLLASLKEPMTWGLVLISTLIMAGDNALSRRAQKKTGSRLLKLYGSPRYRMANYVGILVVISILIFSHAKRQAEHALAGRGKLVTVTYANRAAADDLVLLGTTASFVFLYDSTFERVIIHPHESIHAISFGATE